MTMENDGKILISINPASEEGFVLIDGKVGFKVTSKMIPELESIMKRDGISMESAVSSYCHKYAM